MHLASVPDAASLPDYPIRSDERLNNWFFRWESRRWLNSAVYLTADPEVGYAYLNLIFIAQDQVPIGTLPRDRRLIARLLRIPADHFEALCRRDPSPLAHWEACVTDPGTDRQDIRLMHPFVRDTLVDQLDDRLRKAAATSADATRKRIDRLRSAMQQAGFSAPVVADQRLVERMDAWLTENVRGRRGPAEYDRVFTYAARNKWFAKVGQVTEI